MILNKLCQKKKQTKKPHKKATIPSFRIGPIDVFFKQLIIPSSWDVAFSWHQNHQKVIRTLNLMMASVI
jgi:hypothetical protein